ncbi:MAG: CopG family ribbon-helix-helix protein [Candidatus Micrarchaeia archaeon]
MPIVSLSVNNKLLEEISLLIKEKGYSGKSEVFRAGIRKLIEDKKEKEKLSGNVRAILIITLKEHAGEFITELKHRFSDITDTQIHTGLGKEKCAEIFVLNGDANKIKKLLNELETSKKIENARLIVP